MSSQANNSAFTFGTADLETPASVTSFDAAGNCIDNLPCRSLRNAILVLRAKGFDAHLCNAHETFSETRVGEWANGAPCLERVDFVIEM